MGSKNTIGKRCGGTASRRQRPRGADVYRVAYTVKRRHRIVVGILGRDLNVKGYRCRLCCNGPAASGTEPGGLPELRERRGGIPVPGASLGHPIDLSVGGAASGATISA